MATTIQITEWQKTVTALTFAVRPFEAHGDKYEIIERGQGKGKEYAVARPVGRWCDKMENKEMRSYGAQERKKRRGKRKAKSRAVSLEY